ncbi:AzlC family ABC transporter permease [Limosilactobacillus reuteri]|nr:AzlC family ABC transporter permease [Limosilactobacillus reuteri]
MRNEVRYTFQKTSPVMLVFLFLGASYGIYMYKLGFNFLYPLLMAATIFAGSVEFVIGNLLVQSFQPLTVLVLTALVNSRHIFYGITMLKKYSNTGKLKPILIFGMCDESFSLNATLKVPDSLDRSYAYFYIIAFNYFSWVAGAGLGGLLGGMINLNLAGLDFVMTALFIVLFTEQLKNARTQRDALIGLVFAIICLLFCNKNAFLLVTLVTLVALFSLNYLITRKKMTLTEQIISILIAAVVTMATRFIPFLIFDQSKELSPYLEELEKFLPAAIMGVLVIYCYWNISFAEPSKALLEIVAGLVTLFIHLWKRNMPLSILVGTGFYMVMLNLF